MIAYLGLPQGAAVAVVVARCNSGQRDRDRKARCEAIGARTRERVKGPRSEKDEFIVG